MMNGAKKGQKPKKPIKQKPVKALTGLEIALIGGAAGLAGSMLGGGGKKAAATPLNNPAAMIAPLSGFVGKEEDKEKAPGMKMGGLSGGKRYGAPPKKGPMSRGMKDGGMMYDDAMGMKKLTTYERKQKNIEDRKEEKKQMLEKKGYETGEAKFSREKDRQSPTTQNISKKIRENISDPTINFIDKITGTRPYREGSNKARKEILGYKKGGKIKKTKTKNRSKK